MTLTASEMGQRSWEARRKKTSKTAMSVHMRNLAKKRWGNRISKQLLKDILDGKVDKRGRKLSKRSHVDK